MQTFQQFLENRDQQYHAAQQILLKLHYQGINVNNMTVQELAERLKLITRANPYRVAAIVKAVASGQFDQNQDTRAGRVLAAKNHL